MESLAAGIEISPARQNRRTSEEIREALQEPVRKSSGGGRFTQHHWNWAETRTTRLTLW